MKCPLCNLEMAIQSSRYETQDDDSPDKETRLFIVMELTCRDKKCPNYGKVVQTVKNPLPVNNT